MKFIVALTFLLFSSGVWAESKSGESDSANMVIEMMIVAKATGMCGTFSQITKKTLMLRERRAE